MPRRDPRERLADIVEAGEAIAGYVVGFDIDSFRLDRRTVDAVLRNITVIGEAARSIPDEIRDRQTAIPWVEIADMRNVVVHEYFGVDLDILWRTVTTELPGLIEQLRALIADLGSNSERE